MQCSGARTIEFTEENALPSAKQQGAVIDKDHGGTSDYGGHGMGGRIALQMFVMMCLRGKALEDGDEVLLHCRVGPFINSEPGGGVRVVQVADA